MAQRVAEAAPGSNEQRLLLNLLEEWRVDVASLLENHQAALHRMLERQHEHLAAQAGAAEPEPQAGAAEPEPQAPGRGAGHSPKADAEHGTAGDAGGAVHPYLAAHSETPTIFSSIRGASTPSAAGFRERMHSKWKNTFDVCMGVVVLCNVLLIAAQLQATGKRAGEALHSGTGEPLPVDEGLRVVFLVSEHIINAAYLVELFLRLAFCHGDFSKAANLFDLIILVLTSIDFYILQFLGGTSGSLRVVKILRVGKTLRVIRTMSLFRHLRVLLKTIASSFMSLMWAFVILLLCQLTSALILCQLLQHYITDESMALDTRIWVDRMYGTTAKSMYTLFEITFSGGWPNYARRVIEDVNPFFSIIFVLYVLAVHFAMIRIISAMFLKETLQNAATDADMLIQEKAVEAKNFRRRLGDLFHSADIDQNQLISHEEFAKIAKHPSVRSWFSSMGIDLRESKAVFRLLVAPGKTEVKYDDFVNGLMRLRGPARAQDMAKMIVSHHNISCLAADTKAQLGHVAKSLIVRPRNGSEEAAPERGAM